MKLGTTVTGMLAGASLLLSSAAVGASAPLPDGETRLAGSTRYGTAAAISDSSFTSPIEAVYVASGANYPDALAAGPAAAREGAPVLLVGSSGLPEETAEELQRLNPETIYVVGGESAVSAAAAIELGGHGTVARVEGQDRYATAAAISRANWASSDTILVASGAGFADALSAGPAAARLDVPLLLASPTALPESTRAELVRLAPSQVYVLGGPSAVSDGVAQDIRAATGADVVRIAGADRYETSAAVARDFFSSMSAMFFATGADFPDAVAGTPAAAVNDAPILLTKSTCMPTHIAALKEEKSPSRVVVLGGTSAIAAGATNTACIASTPSDTAAPVLTEFDFSPKSVDVGASAAEVVVTARVVDATGATAPKLVLSSDSTTQDLGFGMMTRISGTATDGVYQRTVTVPTTAAAGTWTVQIYPLDDTLGNSDSTFHNHPTKLTVSSTPSDTAAPAPLTLAASAWGYNVFGQGQIPTSVEPSQAIAAGLQHSLTLRADGTVATWGSNGYGQTAVPTGLTGVTAIAAGAHHSLAVKEDGTVVAWGGTSFGEGDVPAGLDGVTAIAAGGFHSLALKADGTVAAWGSDDYGQIAVPIELSGVTAVRAGWAHSLALKEDGTVVAWGWDEYGQSTVPDGLSGVVAIAPGTHHSLALKDNGTVVAWGSNENGKATVPAGLAGVIAISAGLNHSLALKDDGTVVAWGSNGYGQSAVPAGLTDVTAIAAGVNHSLVLTDDDTVVAWGDNDSGKATVPTDLTSGVTAIAAGDGHGLALTSDGTVVTWGENPFGLMTVPADLDGVTAIAAGNKHSLALRDDGSVVGWGYSYYYGTLVMPGGVAGVRAVAAGAEHSLALKNDGTVVAWGSDNSGQATVPAGLTGVTAIAAGGSHSLALRVDGTVVAWGSDRSGQATVPAGLTGVTAIAAGGSHSLALRVDGTVVAWGGDEFSGQGIVPAGLTRVTAISAGGSHSLALTDDGSVVAWGWNEYGQATVPTGLTGVTAISAGGSHSLALSE